MSAEALSIDRSGPPLPFLLVEPHRAFMEGVATRALAPALRRAPRGDGQPVLVLPGFLAGDFSTRLLRRTLRELGFDAHPWKLGRNLGNRDQMRERLLARVEELTDRHGPDLSIVGWSLGGIYAREIAKQFPNAVRQVVTLGSPFADVERASRASRLYDLFTRDDPESRERRRRRAEAAAQLRSPPPVPSTAIYSKSDGIVHWRACLEPDRAHTENIEVPGSHCGLGVNALALLAVADRLSQPRGDWQPFDRSGWRAYAYR